MRSTEEIQQRFNEVNAWRQWQLTPELAEDADLGYAIPPAAPAPIPDYMTADDSMSVPGIVRALAWVLGGEWEDAYMGGRSASLQGS